MLFSELVEVAYHRLQIIVFAYHEELLSCRPFAHDAFYAAGRRIRYLEMKLWWSLLLPGYSSRDYSSYQALFFNL